MTNQLPADATKSSLAEMAALRALVWGRQNSRTVNRLIVAESMQVVFYSPRYSSVPHPAQRTVFAWVRRLATDGDVIKLDVNDPENRI